MSGVAALAFFGGFCLYWIYNSQKSKNYLSSGEKISDKKKLSSNSQTKEDSVTYIPLEKLERILRKIKNKIIILLANLYDKTYVLRMIEEQKEDASVKNNKEDVLVQTISSAEIAKIDESNASEKSINATYKIPRKYQMKYVLNCNIMLIK